MARRATAEEIRASGQKEFEIPGMVDEAGEPLTLLVRKVHAGERMSLMPPTPASLFEKLPDDPDARKAELTERERSWIDSMTAEQKAVRQAEANDFCYRLVAAATLEPPMTVEDARGLGDAALTLADQIQKWSSNEKPAQVVAA